jgi:HlyD family secretion protein
MAANPETRRVLPLILWTVSLAIIVTVAVAALRTLTRERVGIRTTYVTYQDLTSTVPTNGRVELVDEYQAHAIFAGQVQQIDVEVGQHVAAGTLLVQMDDSDAKARVASATSALRTAELALADIQHGGTQDERNSNTTDLARIKTQQRSDAESLEQLKQLQAKGAASSAEIAAAQQRIELDQQNLQAIQTRSTQRYGGGDTAKAEAQIAEAKANLAAATIAVTNADIRSPYAGTVYAIPVSQYDYVNAGEDLLNVADLNRLQITAYFDEPEIGHLAQGQAVKIVWDAKPERTWHGHVERAPTTVVAYGTRNVGECLITVDDAQGDLAPNSNVTVTVTTQQRPHVLSIPRAALHTDGAQNFVFLIVKNELVQTPVQIGVLNNTRVEITGGLKENERLALNAVTNRDLTNGMAVRIVK